jgi:hypothetical protein
LFILKTVCGDKIVAWNILFRSGAVFLRGDWVVSGVTVCISVRFPAILIYKKQKEFNRQVEEGEEAFRDQQPRGKPRGMSFS